MLKNNRIDIVESIIPKSLYPTLKMILAVLFLKNNKTKKKCVKCGRRFVINKMLKVYFCTSFHSDVCIKCFDKYYKAYYN